jgi:hypothetical protein
MTRLLIFHLIVIFVHSFNSSSLIAFLLILSTVSENKLLILMFSFHRHFKSPHAHFIVTSFSSLSLFYFVSSHFFHFSYHMGHRVESSGFSQRMFWHKFTTISDDDNSLSSTFILYRLKYTKTLTFRL